MVLMHVVLLRLMLCIVGHCSELCAASTYTARLVTCTKQCLPFVRRAYSID
jgi:hypothetical protein